MYITQNIDSWKRKDLYNFYRDFDDPHFNITGNIEVTQLHDICKKEKRSFFLSMLYYSIAVANEVKAFRYRMLEDKVICYDVIHPGSTILYDDNTFGFCYFDYKADYDVFLKEGKEKIEKQKANRDLKPESDHSDLIHYSFIPWIKLTAFKHARDNKIDPTIPKLIFGKYYNEGDKVMISMSVEVHHALADGYDVGMLFEKLEKTIREL